ncbi:MAG: hypothetical protein A2W90_06555 [Bacteroidetes bacterium GWF2_42_66]|nr:MAG: hypothetical protein A2W92_02105 [Bacteroidetes bacterium GWA2_42_15]OFY02815.1 MAG: hypothetical protein A2W89_23965 [Bacteroidetes bacterium GWE2_42_39]OFY44469.1 MAG: hypothetical protein A2W90_06555 [Bacteroidetes bacterium GWF2_42_66]HBL74986.1 transcriptional regulator [Prolixibacteraceae bacterium]HCR89110.1 transcriptional regulator [Prolixibacteraceae bacterium]
MENNGYDWRKMSDVAIAEKIAVFIKHTRLELNKTQNDLAFEAGITRRTLTAIESGKKNLNVITLIQILRALNSLHVLDGLKVTTQISPLQLAKLEQEKRKRATSVKQENKKPKSDW